MSATLHPILSPVKGAPDITVSKEGETPETLLVFVGLALMETVSANKDNPSFKLLLARLYNARVPGRMLAEAFTIARSTIQRWAAALKSGDPDRLQHALSGQGAPQKVTPYIERYALDRYRKLKGEEKAYNAIIREDIEKYFGVTLSSERLRQIFRKADPDDHVPPEVYSEQSTADPDASGCEPELHPPVKNAGLGANSCDTASQPPDNEADCDSSRNHSRPPPQAVLPLSGYQVGTTAEFVHHAGLLLMTPLIEELLQGWQERPDVPRQWIAQVLQGAVNREQGKGLHFDSLAKLIGPCQRASNTQSKLLGQIASADTTFDLLKRNGQLIGQDDDRLFYFDPHTSSYTGVCKIMKGWCGGKGRVEKIINMDFIHDHRGSPCFVQHADAYFDMRLRFLACAELFHRTRRHSEESLIWVIDRGIYGLNHLRRIRSVLNDHIITWEKDYKRDGWQADKPAQRFEMRRERNCSSDLRLYRFEWQVQPWQRDPSFQRIIVRATNPRGNTIEVSILYSDAEGDPPYAIIAIFNRWLQENDFGYLIRHFGIDELTSRAHTSYEKIADKLADQEVESRACKELKKQQNKAQSALKKLLFKQDRQQDRHKEKKAKQRTELSKQARIIKGLKANRPADHQGLARAQKKYIQLKDKWSRSENKAREATEKLQQQIQQQKQQLAEIDDQFDLVVKTESRLDALIEEQYMQMDTRRKAFMDAVRICSRNIFYELIRQFRPLYDNYRDDHFVLRELTRSPGVIQLHEGVIDVKFIPAMQYQPAVQDTITRFLSQMSEKVNKQRGPTFAPIRFALLYSDSEPVKIDCVLSG